MTPLSTPDLSQLAELLDDLARREANALNSPNLRRIRRLAPLVRDAYLARLREEAK